MIGPLRKCHRLRAPCSPAPSRLPPSRLALYPILQSDDCLQPRITVLKRCVNGVIAQSLTVNRQRWHNNRDTEACSLQWRQAKAFNVAGKQQGAGVGKIGGKLVIGQVWPFKNGNCPAWLDVPWQ